MKLVVMAYGTRGDVQPMLSLAYALQERGHQVRMLVPRNAAEWVGRAGIACTPLPLDVQAMFAQEPAQRMLAAGRIQAFFKWLAQEEKAYMLAMREVLVAGCADADAIISHVLLEDRAAAIGAARGIPVLPVYFFPVAPSSHLPSPFISTRNLGPLNRLTHKLMLDMLWKLSRDDVAALRRELGVQPASDCFVRTAQRKGNPSLLAYSEAIVPRPKDYGPHNHVVGGLLMPQRLRERLGEASVPAALASWIEAGPPPVFLGFGSMPVLDTQALLAATRNALSAVSVRAVIGAGWTELPAGGDEQAFAIGSVDHLTLLPRCAAAVHHGGAGTTYASLRCGVPTFIYSVFADQPFWGTRCRALGVGDTLPFKRLRADTFERALRGVLQPAVQQQAQAMGKRLQDERGLERALEVIERELPRMRPPE